MSCKKSLVGKRFTDSVLVNLHSFSTDESSTKESRLENPPLHENCILKNVLLVVPVFPSYQMNARVVPDLLVHN